MGRRLNWEQAHRRDMVRASRGTPRIPREADPRRRKPTEKQLSYLKSLRKQVGMKLEDLPITRGEASDEIDQLKQARRDAPWWSRRT